MKGREITNIGLVLVLLSLGIGSCNQNEKPMDLASVEASDEFVQNPDSIHTFVEKQASFPGGEAELYRFLSGNIVYPAIARESNITGRVVLSFVVEKDGRVTDVNVVRKLGGGCDEEAVRVVKSMPKWVPAVQKGRDVRQRYTLPLKFKLAG